MAEMIFARMVVEQQHLSIQPMSTVAGYAASAPKPCAVSYSIGNGVVGYAQFVAAAEAYFEYTNVYTVTCSLKPLTSTNSFVILIPHFRSDSVGASASQPEASV